MAKKDNKKNNQSLASAVKSVGPVISKSEAQKIANQTGKSVAQVVAKATDKGVSVGSALVNQVSKTISAPLTGATAAIPSKTLEALAPLQNLQMNPGTVYSGYSTTTTPASQTRTVNGGVSSTPASTTYNPIVLPKSSTTAAGSSNTTNQGNGGNANDPYQSLRDQIDAAQQTINDLQNQPVDPYADITNLLAEQQAAAAAQQEAMAAQAAQQQQALQDLMIQQQQAYETQMADARRQQEAMAAQAAEAQRQAMAVANAYVPGLEPTAAAPALGDARNMTRSSATNTLSNLSILTGMGTSAGVTATPAAATPLAGLQIA